ncbi:protein DETOXIFICATION 27-like [Papaver somniferum]|uniref:protein DETOXIFICATION 27-like n=1 Tax=Papaver somniferum TaxID=3469 RepID=UPI000E7056E6|nr:protein DETOXIFICATION 27-like [Papaver somniferum]
MEKGVITNGGRREERLGPLLDGSNGYHSRNKNDLARRVWIESKKLWHTAGPGIFNRISAFSITVSTQAFAGHLGNLELASVAISINVFFGFSFGLMYGMASALETLCGQAYGAKRYHMLGIFLQRSWIVQFVTAILLLPLFFFISPILRFLGQPDDVAELSGLLSLWLIPLHFAYAVSFPLQRFLQSQLKAYVSAGVALFAVTVHIFMSWLFVYKLGVGIIGSVITVSISWWIISLGLFCYVVCGGFPGTWDGFSVEAFSGLWDYFKLSAASCVMMCYFSYSQLYYFSIHFYLFFCLSDSVVRLWPYVMVTVRKLKIFSLEIWY